MENEESDENQIKNTISAINTGAFGLGAIVGPILASVLTSIMNYRNAFVVVCAIVLIVLLLLS